MNVTETFEEVLRLARHSPESQARPSRAALIAFAGRVKRMRRRLDAQRRLRRLIRLEQDSSEQLHDELTGLKACDACDWRYPAPKASQWNPLAHCTGDFGCAMECLRYKSCEWHPDILKS